MIKSNVSLASARLEGSVVQVIKAWATSFPAELVAFDRQQKNLRGSLYSKNGMSCGGNMRYAYEIPVRLDQAMSCRFGRMWRRNRELRRYFFDNFKVGLVGRRGRGGGKAWMKVM